MLINKEYPAAHSMSTAWYISDDDGNVGIMEFEDNGPVPAGIPGDFSAEDLVYGCDTEWNDVEIDFSQGQIDELLTETKLRKDEEWSFLAIKVKENRETDFEKLCKALDIEIERPISHKFRLYKIFVHEKKGLSELITSGLIEKGYLTKNLWMNDEWQDGEMKIIKDFDSVPFYIFYQPYDPFDLPVKVCTPVNPIKMSQLPSSIRDKVLRIPGLFSDLGTFQISQLYKCFMHGGMWDNGTVNYMGCEYGHRDATGENDRYVLVTIDDNYDFEKAKSAPLFISKEDMDKLLASGEAKLKDRAE